MLFFQLLDLLEIYGTKSYTKYNLNPSLLNIVFLKVVDYTNKNNESIDLKKKKMNELLFFVPKKH